VTDTSATADAVHARTPAAAVLRSYATSLAVCLAFAGAALLAIGRLDQWDEMWFLQVATRLASGDVLYRDVFFGAGPISPYIGSLIVSLAGPEALPVKLAGVGLLAAMVALLRWISVVLAQPVSGPLIAGFCLVLIGSTQFSYAPLATVFVLGSMGSMVAWCAAHRKSRRWIAAAGACAGLAIATKQDAGLYAAAAVIATIVATALIERKEWRARVVDAGVAALFVVLVPVAMLGPVLLAGGTPQLLDYALLNKGRYVENASVGYVAGALSELSMALAFHGDAILRATRAFAFVVPPCVVILTIVGWQSASRRDDTVRVAVALFSVAGIAAMFPRASAPHVLMMLPVMIAATIYWLPFALERVGRGQMVHALRGGRAHVTGVVLCIAVSVAAALSWILGAPKSVSDIPPIRGVVQRTADLAAVRAQADALRDASQHDSLFLLMPDAGLYYLAAGIRNQTPFDYPLVTSMGRDGEQQVMDRIAAGEITAVCVGRPGVLVGLEASTLIAYVESRFVPGPALASCRLYMSPGRP
jgi:hypothetical protein